MKTITLASPPIKAYSYEEMINDPKLKEALIKANPIGDSLEEFLMDHIVDSLVDQLEEGGFDSPKIYYDLSCSQGSGACFDFNSIDFQSITTTFSDRFKFLEPYMETVRYLHDNDIELIEVSTTRNHFANHYCHSRTRNLYMDLVTQRIDEISELSSPSAKIAIELLKTEEFNDMMKLLVAEMEDLYQDRCYMVYKTLQDELDRIHSDEFILEDMKLNLPLKETLFLEDGRIINIDNYNILCTSLSPLEEYVLLDQDGKVLSFTTSDLDKDFIDTIDDSDLGRSKALVFTTIGELAKELQNMTGYSLIPVSEAFKSVEKENKENANS